MKRSKPKCHHWNISMTGACNDGCGYEIPQDLKPLELQELEREAHNNEVIENMRTKGAN